MAATTAPAAAAAAVATPPAPAKKTWGEWVTDKHNYYVVDFLQKNTCIGLVGKLAFNTENGTLARIAKVFATIVLSSVLLPLALVGGVFNWVTGSVCSRIKTDNQQAAPPAQTPPAPITPAAGTPPGVPAPAGQAAGDAAAATALAADAANRAAQATATAAAAANQPAGQPAPVVPPPQTQVPNGDGVMVPPPSAPRI